MIHETILAIIIAFTISALLCPIIIPFLHKLKFGQQVRGDGPRSHLKKQGTPTMGSLTVLSSIIITSVFHTPSYPKIIPVLSVTVGFGIIGFLSGYIKIVMERSERLKLMQELVGQFTTTGIFAWYLLSSGEVGTDMLIPFTRGFDGGSLLPLGIFFVSALFFIMLGTDNGANSTDGLDGLCTNVTTLIAIFLTIAAIGEDMGINPTAGVVVESLLRFLLFDVYPVKMFMGGTGSLTLDGFVAASCYMMHTPLFIPVVGLIYLVEVLSVIIQVTYFKRTDGKRISKMVPICHHFELCGWPETRVVTVFTIVAAILYMVTYLRL